MHLLNVHSLQLETFYNEQIPSYAILSHTWETEEVTFQNIRNRHLRSTRSLAGFEKIRRTCEQAKLDEHQYVWIDTCCIDKSSSAELTEAINSMFQWYANAATCYVYLSDVEETAFERTFRGSRWFSRGWTLQELIAPTHVLFYDRNWQRLRFKIEHAALISLITGVDIEVLCGEIPNERLDGEGTIARYCVAKRMSWAANRKTTRIEDMAYCLLGIFQINMPLLYGEGERAFIRLQEEIMRNLDDDSILAWDLDYQKYLSLEPVPRIVERAIHGGHCLSSILASSPKNFEYCQDLEYCATSNMPFTMTNMGLRIQMPLITVYAKKPLINYRSLDEVLGWIGLLRCSTGVSSEFLGIILVPAKRSISSSTKVERASFGTPKKRTVIVGPRAAAKAVQKEITIIPDIESNFIRNYICGYRHIILIESQTFLDSGYKLLDAVVPNASPYKNLGGDLDWYTKTFTIEFKDFDYDLIRFRFQHNVFDSGFSIYVRGTHAGIREGISNSDSVERKIFEDLTNDTTDFEKENPVCHEIIERGTTIQVSTSDKEVSFSQIIQIHIDLI